MLREAILSFATMFFEVDFFLFLNKNNIRQLKKLTVKLYYVKYLCICMFFFRTLQYVNDLTWFTFLSFFIRGLEALGASAYCTASYVFVVHVFPDHVGTIRVSVTPSNITSPKTNKLI